MVTRAISDRLQRGIGAISDDVVRNPEELAKVLNQMRLRVIAAQSDAVAALSASSSGATPAPVPGPPGPPGPPPAPPAPDLTPPPTPSGVNATAGLNFIIVTTDAPTFSEGHGYDRTIVYGAQYSGAGPLPSFSAAVVVHEFRGQVGSWSVEPGTQWHIWTKWRTNDGVLSVSPSGGANGHQVNTGQDISHLLQVLTGQITTSQLQAALNARINLIDGSGTGSVNERITISEAGLQAQITTLGITVGNNSAAIASEAVVRANADGFISAYYGLRTQVSQGGRTVVGGIGIMGTSGGTAGPTIDVGVVANKFYVTAPAGTTGVGDVLPFVIQTADETVNGVVIPRGVYMDAAFIKNLQAITARLGDAWITNAMVANMSVDKLITGSVAVGQFIQSSDFVTGLSGWRLGGNTAEIGSASIRGLLTASQIDTRGLDIKDSFGNIVFSANQNLDWTRIGGALKPKVFRVVSRGFGTAGAPTESGLYNAETGALLVSPGRSYILVLLSRATGAVTFSRVYDVYGLGETGGFTAAHLAADLNATTSADVVVLFTHDEPLNLHTSSGLPAAIYRNGGSRGKFESPSFQSRGAYMLISYGNCSEGNALFEGYAGLLPFGVDGPDDAWIDTTFTLISGNVVVGGGALAGFKLDGSNITTYIASAAITSALIQSLTADKITTGSLTGQTITGGTFTGAIFQTASSGQRVIINEAGSNEARFYGNRGDGVVELLASLGINAVGADSTVLQIGSANTSRHGIYARSSNRIGVLGQSTSDSGVEGVSSSADGVLGDSATSYGVRGFTAGNNVAGVCGVSFVGGNSAGVQGFSNTSGPGVYGGPGVSGSTGYGGDFLGNATRAAIRAQGVYATPPAAEDGAIAVLTTPVGNMLCWADGGQWWRAGNFRAVWSDAPPP